MLYFVSQCYTFTSSQLSHLCFLDNLFFLLSNILLDTLFKRKYLNLSVNKYNV